MMAVAFLPAILAQGARDNKTRKKKVFWEKLLCGLWFVGEFQGKHFFLNRSEIF